MTTSWISAHPRLTRLLTAVGAAAVVAGPGLPALAADKPVDLSLPQVAGPGAPKETRTLLDSDAVKLVVITLRQGTVLPEHSAAAPVTIQTIAGTGTMQAGGDSHALRPGSLLVLPPGLPHEITPAPGGDLILLVTYLKGRTAPAGDHHHH